MNNPAITSPATADAPTIEQPARAKINRLGLFSISAAHTSVDMQTGSLAVLLPLLLAQFNLSYGLATLIVSMNNLIIAIAQPLFGILGEAANSTRQNPRWRSSPNRQGWYWS